MANRKRPIVLCVPVTTEERELIEKKMAQLHTKNFSAYARKMLIDGYIINVDHSDIRTQTAELQKIGVNVNQIAKRINSTGTVYAQDVEDIKGALAEIWQLQRYGYECDTRTADAEFLLSKRQYANLTGRNRGADDVIAYHLRQAFKPGEVTPEKANQIGRELALKLTKGTHAFVVCTHVDKHHVHNHIIINSTTLDCQKKFRNFWGSAWAIRRMNDKLCLEHGLSIVENPKPSRDHYGTWMGSQKQPSHQEQLRWAIDAALEEKPKDFEELLKKLEAAGIEVNQERKYLRFRLSPEDRYTRCDTLKGDYTEQAIKERIAGTRTVKPRRTSPQKPVSKAGLLVDIEAAVRSGKGSGHERWVKVFNLKQLSQAVIWLKEHGNMSYEDLQKKSDAATASFNALSVQIKELESQMAANGELQKQIVNYAKTRAIYVEYRKAGYSKKFGEAYETEILLHQAAKKYFDEVGITKLPPSNLCGRNMPDFWKKKGKPILLTNRPEPI